MHRYLAQTVRYAQHFVVLKSELSKIEFMNRIRIKLPFAAILTLGMLSGSFSIVIGQPAGPGASAIPVIQMQDVPLNMAIANLARQASLNYILDPKLTDPPHGPDGKYVPPPSVSVWWENLTAKAALARLLGEHGLQAIESPVSSVTRITFTNQVANTVDKAWVAADTNAAIPLIQMQDMPLDKALPHLAKAAQLNVVLDPSLSNPSLVAGKQPTRTPMVFVRWEKLTARQAIAALCENYDLLLAVNPTTGEIRISPKSKSRQ